MRKKDYVWSTMHFTHWKLIRYSMQVYISLEKIGDVAADAVKLSFSETSLGVFITDEQETIHKFEVRLFFLSSANLIEARVISPKIVEIADLDGGSVLSSSAPSAMRNLK